MNIGISAELREKRENCKHIPRLNKPGYPGLTTDCSICGAPLVFSNPVRGKVNMSKKDRRRQKAAEIAKHGRPLTERERTALLITTENGLAKQAPASTLNKATEDYINHVAFVGDPTPEGVTGLMNQEAMNEVL